MPERNSNDVEFDGTANPKLVDVKLVSSGWINKYILTYELPDGQVIEYESVSRKGLEAYKARLKRHAEGEGGSPSEADAVCIVPVLSDGSLLLIREFRYSVNAWVVAFPAGLVDPGEEIRECIERELAEETGYCLRGNADEAVRLLPQSGYSSVGMSEENVCIAIAQVEPAGAANLQHIEMIEPFVLKREEIAAFLESNSDLIGTRAQLILECFKE